MTMFARINLWRPCSLTCLVVKQLDHLHNRILLNEWSSLVIALSPKILRAFRIEPGARNSFVERQSAGTWTYRLIKVYLCSPLKNAFKCLYNSLSFRKLVKLVKLVWCFSKVQISWSFRSSKTISTKIVCYPRWSNLKQIGKPFRFNLNFQMMRQYGRCEWFT